MSFMFLATAAWTWTPASGADDLETLEQQAFQAAVARVAPSAVRIETVGGKDAAMGANGPTTGLVVDAEGYIVSSKFGFLHRPDSILVQLPDGARKPARLVATDHVRMIVLLKIDADNPLAVPEMASRKQMRVGQWTIAIGRTFEGKGPNLSVGVLSALERIWGKAIQSDVAASPANYGGPLVDIQGRVLGVLAPLSPQAGDIVGGLEWYDSGIAFAVPAEDIVRVLPRLKKGEDLKPGLLGIGLPPGDASTAEPVIAACQPGSAAAKAGIQAGDHVVEIEGRAITRAAEVKDALGRRYAGDAVALVVQRGDKRLPIKTTLAAELPSTAKPETRDR